MMAWQVVWCLPGRPSDFPINFIWEGSPEPLTGPDSLLCGPRYARACQLLVRRLGMGRGGRFIAHIYFMFVPCKVPKRQDFHLQ